MSDEARRARRGPKPNPDRGTPSGYRLTARRRFELQMAATFVGSRNLQETLDAAVDEFLSRLHSTEGFDAALLAAEASQRNLQNVPTIGDV